MSAALAILALALLSAGLLAALLYRERQHDAERRLLLGIRPPAPPTDDGWRDVPDDGLSTLDGDARRPEAPVDDPWEPDPLDPDLALLNREMN